MSTKVLEDRTAVITGADSGIGITKASAYEYSSRGIRINAVCPGAVDTPCTFPAKNAVWVRSAAPVNPWR